MLFTEEIVYRKPFAARKTFCSFRGRARFIEGDAHGRAFEDLCFCNRLNSDIVDHDDKTTRGIVNFDRAMRDTRIVQERGNFSLKLLDSIDQVECGDLFNADLESERTSLSHEIIPLPRLRRIGRRPFPDKLCSKP